MLIKLSCGTELNPDQIIYIRHYGPEGWQSHIAHVHERSLSITDDELAKIRAYHAKTVVVEDPRFIQQVGRITRPNREPDHVVNDFADGRYDAPPKTVAKPFTVQELPKDEQSLWMQKIYKLALEFIASSEKYFSEGVSLHAKECAGIAYLPDCSGSQHESKKKDCSTCKLNYEKTVFGHFECICCFHPSRKNWTPRS